MTRYAVVLDGARLEALVVGGGAVAARKAAALLDGGASVRVVAPDVGGELRVLAAASERLTIAVREYASGDIADALLVIAATGDRGTNARIAGDARALSRLVNVADAPDEGNCVTPAVHRAGDVLVAVVAGGVPAAAARVRDHIGERIDERYAAVVRALGELRSRLLRAGERERWRRASEELVGDDFCRSVENGTLLGRVRAWR